MHFLLYKLCVYRSIRGIFIHADFELVGEFITNWKYNIE